MTVQNLSLRMQLASEKSVSEMRLYQSSREVPARAFMDVVCHPPILAHWRTDAEHRGMGIQK